MPPADRRRQGRMKWRDGRCTRRHRRRWSRTSPPSRQPRTTMACARSVSMSLATLELLAGIVLAVVTLRDVFDTVVVPGGSRATLRVARRSVFLMLPLWKRMRGRDGISTTFAPLVLVGSFIIWMML